MPVTDNNFTDYLVALKTHYEQALTEANTNVSHLREQLSHVNALLLNQLVPTQALIKSAEPAPTLQVADAQVERLALAPVTAEAPAIDTPEPKASSRKPKVAPEPTPVLGKRSPRPLLPAHEGLTRLEAIAQLLQATPGEEVTAAQISEGLFGTLSAADHKAERKSLNTQLYKGQSLKLWQKGTAPGTFRVEAQTSSKSTQPTPKTPATKAKAPAKTPATTTAKRKSLTLLPAYAQLTKRDAITQVLTAASGEVLHQDTIIKTLYGVLSLEELKEERTRIKTALLTGVKDGKWQKAFEPSSYFIKAAAPGAKPKKSVGKPKPQTAEAEAATAIAPTKPPTPKAKSAKKRISLTVLPAFEGMTKLDAIAAVLGQNLGEVLHQDTIIQMLYGDLSLEDLKKERVRIDTCLRNGVKSNKWKKAPVAASYVLEAKAVAAKPKPGRKPAGGKAKASKSKRTEAELLKILQKADIQV
jgi:hypothetical protein